MRLNFIKKLPPAACPPPSCLFAPPAPTPVRLLRAFPPLSIPTPAPPRRAAISNPRPAAPILFAKPAFTLPHKQHAAQKKTKNAKKRLDKTKYFVILPPERLFLCLTKKIWLMDFLNFFEMPAAILQFSAVAVATAAIVVRTVVKKRQQKLKRAASAAAARLRFEVYR